MNQLRDVVAGAAKLSSLADKCATVDLGDGFSFDGVRPMSRDETTAAAREAIRRSDRPAYLFTSGGSTGVPHLAWIPAELHVREIERHWQPFAPGDVVANLAMPGRLWSAHLFYNRLAERVGAGVIGLGHVDEEEWPGWADFLYAQGTTAVVGTPSQLADLVRFLTERRHQLLAQLRTAVWFGEPFTARQEEVLHAADIAIHGNYGSTETWVIGHNGPDCATDSFHLLPHQHVELVDGAEVGRRTWDGAPLLVRDRGRRGRRDRDRRRAHQGAERARASKDRTATLDHRKGVRRSPAEAALRCAGTTRSSDEPRARCSCAGVRCSRSCARKARPCPLAGVSRSMHGERVSLL